MYSVINLLAVLLSIASLTSAAPIAPEPLHKLALRKAPLIRDGEDVHMAYRRHYEQAIKRSQPLRKRISSDNQAIRRSETLEEPGYLARRAGPSSSVSKAASATTSVPKATITISANGSNAGGFPSNELHLDENLTVVPSEVQVAQAGLGLNDTGNDVPEFLIGTPPRPFRLQVDTGSADTWVASTRCTTAGCGKHQRLGPSDSSTFKDLQTSWGESYGAGSVVGNLCTDTISFAGFKLENHTFGTVTSETVFQSNVYSDGLMGLAFSIESQQGTATPIESLQSTGQVKQAILGIALGRAADGSNDGEIVFGQADSSKFDASTTQTLPVVTSDGTWQVDMKAVTVNGKVVTANTQALLDTGTTLIYAPYAEVEAFHQQIPGSINNGENYTIPCTTSAVVTLTFGNAAFQIDARDLVFLPSTSDLTGQCYSSVLAGNAVENDGWLLGDTFLKNVYMTTNEGARTIQLSARTDAPHSEYYNH
ncbi:MAG: hypothetical protein TREMPRED_001717 [Tremellales sp. Tagirdzhanova-0007]|nr:MAG: hypothetical protein TREMPRED_001717 [Tremellales sp. Tagirdzhanova-0007]